jgi:modulator of FtsH protease
VTGYTTEGWGDVFLAAAGASAALSGLIFVAVSVNIRPVLEADERAGGSFLTGRATKRWSPCSTCSRSAWSV